MEIGPVVWEE